MNKQCANEDEGKHYGNQGGSGNECKCLIMCAG